MFSMILLCVIAALICIRIQKLLGILHNATILFLAQCADVAVRLMVVTLI